MASSTQRDMATRSGRARVQGLFVWCTCFMFSSLIGSHHHHPLTSDASRTSMLRSMFPIVSKGWDHPRIPLHCHTRRHGLPKEASNVSSQVKSTFCSVLLSWNLGFKGFVVTPKVRSLMREKQYRT